MTPSAEPRSTVASRVLASFAITVLAFANEARAFAGTGGFSASHTKAMEKMAASIDHYVEEAIDIGRTGHGDPQLVHAYLMAAADFIERIRDPKAAELIRRRAGGARPEEPARQVVEI